MVKHLEEDEKGDIFLVGDVTGICRRQQFTVHLSCSLFHLCASGFYFLVERTAPG
jgi:hypothetical protein